MMQRVRSALALVGALAAMAAGLAAQAPAGTPAVPGTPGSGKGGRIIGHIRQSGPAPGNPVMRMGVDPVCATMNRDGRPVQQFVVKAADGALAHVFVALQGTFPKTPVPTQPVTITQEKCIYGPRMVAGRVGQTLMIVNRDQTLHNLHSISSKGNDFNVTQPQFGMVFSYKLKSPDVMMRLTCDVHSWMLGYIGVVDHPYFAVTGADGAFTIDNVPAGRQTVRIWHEVFGEMTKTVVVKAGETVTADLVFTGPAKKAARVQDLVVPVAPTTPLASALVTSPRTGE